MTKMREVKYAIGIDLGGTFIKYALVAEDGLVQYESKLATEADKGKEQVLNNIRFCMKDTCDFARDKGLKIIGAGIGTPGIIDGGVVLGGAENLPEWENIPLSQLVRKDFNFPVFVDNDANMMGLGEVRFGSNKFLKDAIFLTVGTGVGGAMVLDGKLYGGHRNRGAELGHIIINCHGADCSCGAKGCLEAHASTSALIRDYIEICTDRKKMVDEAIVDGKFIVEKYHQKEAEAISAMNLHFDYLATGITSFINIFSPQKIVVGGGISEAGYFYIQEIRTRVLKLVMKETSVFTEIGLAELGNKAGFLGSAALAFDNTKSN